MSGLSLSNGAAVRAAILSAALPVLGSQIGMAIGALIRRHQSGAIGAAWAVLLLLPIMLASGTIGLGAVTEAMPVSVWMALAHTASTGAGQSPLPPSAAAWILLLAWPLASVAVSATVVSRRDV